MRLNIEYIIAEREKRERERRERELDEGRRLPLSIYEPPCNGDKPKEGVEHEILCSNNRPI